MKFWCLNLRTFYVCVDSLQKKICTVLINLGVIKSDGFFPREFFIKNKIKSVVGRIRTCAGRAQWISSPSP